MAGNLEERVRILEESKKRMKTISFGDPVTNICAGDGNPTKHSYFVAYKINSRKNSYGINHKEYLARCTDKKGKFWETGIDVIYPGHLSAGECEKLWTPVWEAKYGGR